MFDWFWEFLYAISKTLMQVCDLLMYGARVLIGIDEMQIGDENTDMLTYLLRSSYAARAFGAVFSIAVIVVFIFAVIAIVRNAFKEQQNTTPLKILFSVLQNILYFLAVPVIMLALVFFMNTLLKAINEATQYGNQTSIGAFLFTVFAKDAGLNDADMEYFLSGDLDYKTISVVSSKVVLSDFNFILCWIVSGVIIYNLGASLVSFVERAISILILYIVSPLSIASSILDEGARYKAWREQVISKFLSSYGIIIAMNIYIMFCALISSDDVVFFSSDLMNDLTKVFILLGGAFSMRKAHTLIGHLVSTASAQDISDPNNAAGRGLLGGMIKHSPLGVVGSAVGEAASKRWEGFKSKIGEGILNAFGVPGAGGQDKLGGGGGGGGKPVQGAPDQTNNQKPDYNKQNEENLRDALGDEDSEQDNKEKSNTNTNQVNQNNNNKMNNILANNNTNTNNNNENNNNDNSNDK